MKTKWILLGLAAAVGVAALASRGGSVSGTTTVVRDPARLANIERALIQLHYLPAGYQSGPGTDDVNGVSASNAASLYQRDHGLPVSGLYTEEMYHAMFGPNAP